MRTRRVGAVVAGSATALGVSIPFGVGNPAENTYGGQVWDQTSFALDDVLLQCRRFCDHPTFDQVGVYNVRSPFDPTYARTCYRPLYPMPPDGGFPFDP